MMSSIYEIFGHVKNAFLKQKRILFVFVLLLSVISSVLLFSESFPRNHAFRQALFAVLSQPSDYQSAIASLDVIASQDCRIYWQIGLLSPSAGSLTDNESTFKNMLNCSSRSVDWLYLLAPQREDLALRASQLYPQNTKTWLWLGDLAYEDEEFLLAEQYFLQSTQQDTSYGLAWCRLGRVQEQQNLLDDAKDAYWQCCKNGDPGSNGCYRAGRVAEKLGDIPNAIRYYRRSHYQPALDRADELEASQ